MGAGVPEFDFKGPGGFFERDREFGGDGMNVASAEVQRRIGLMGPRSMVTNDGRPGKARREAMDRCLVESQARLPCGIADAEENHGAREGQNGRR